MVWLVLPVWLCLSACPALAESTNIVMRVGERIYTPEAPPAPVLPDPALLVFGPVARVGPQLWTACFRRDDGSMGLVATDAGRDAPARARASCARVLP
jgi:hypothetical protein